MMIVTLRIKVPPELHNEVQRTARLVMGPTRVQPGCISCRLYKDTEDPNVMTLWEEWECRSDLDQHIRSDDYRKILALLDLSSTPPEIKFNTVSATQGMEVIRPREGKSANGGKTNAGGLQKLQTH